MRKPLAVSRRRWPRRKLSVSRKLQSFAHLALHITPESVRERQPLASPDGQILLVADARIDNWDALIHLLAEKDLRAGPEITDPEIIHAAYRLWGRDCAARLLGDFAFAIWDASLQHLFAACDPMGMRAFYYRCEPQRLLLGTEVKQILAAPEVSGTNFRASGSRRRLFTALRRFRFIYLAAEQLH